MSLGTSPVMQLCPSAPQHVPGHEPGHNCSLRRATARARLRNARKTFPATCWRKEPHPETKTATPSPRETAQKDKTVPMQRNNQNFSSARPGHETGPNRSPHRAAARERLRFTRESFPAACWMKMKPHPCNETAPMQRTLLNRAPARPRARDRPQPFPALCCSTCAATIHEENVPGRELERKGKKPHPRNENHNPFAV